MTRPIRHTSLALALLAFTAACHSASPPTQGAGPAAAPTTATGQTGVPAPDAVTQQQKDAAPLQYAQMRLMEALGARCDWLAPAEQAAVAASIAERHAWLVWQGLDTAGADAQAEGLIGQAAGIDCDSAEGQQQRLGVGYGAWQMRSSWALRGQAMLPGADRPGWFAGKSTVVNQQAALDEAVAGLKAIEPSSVETSQTMFQQQAEQMLVARCEAADPDCPGAGTDAGFRTYAEAVIQQTEGYAQVLAQTDDKTGRPPESAAGL